MADTIFIVNRVPTNDYVTLEAFSTVEVNMTRGILDLKKLDKIERIFRGYFAEAEDGDYLCLSGAAVVCALALKVWFEYRTNCKLLHWTGGGYTLYDMNDDPL